MNGIQDYLKSESAQNVNPLIGIREERISGNRLSLTGQRFGRLMVVEYAGTKGEKKTKATIWKVKCDCGNELIVRGGDLKSGKTTSCGCLQKDRTSNALTKHGYKGKPIYNTWQSMKSRCSNLNSHDFKYYGGRGIIFCQRWKHFENFLADMGEKPKGLTLERKDNNGNYCPENCCWATRKEQNRNTSRTRNITHNGETMCLNDWAIKLDIHRATLYSRLRRYPAEIAFNMPQRSYNALTGI